MALAAEVGDQQLQIGADPYAAARRAQMEAEQLRRETDQLRQLRNELARAVKATADNGWPIGNLVIRPHGSVT